MADRPVEGETHVVHLYLCSHHNSRDETSLFLVHLWLFLPRFQIDLSLPEMSQPVPSESQSRFGTLAVVVGLVVLIVTAQILTRIFGTGSVAASAGRARGDIRLPQDVLPAELNGWNVVAFQEPKEGDVPGVIGWSHSWTLQKDQGQVLVSFDQVGFMGWHELTQCYEATGWTLSERQVRTSGQSPSAFDWSYVQAQLEKPSGERAVLMYSIFNGDGDTVLPVDAPNKTEGIFDRLTQARGTRKEASAEASRCLQVQLLIPSGKLLPEEDREEMSRLHLETREILRRHWTTASGRIP